MKTILLNAVLLGAAMTVLADDVRVTSGVADILKLSQAQISAPSWRRTSRIHRSRTARARTRSFT